MKHYSTGLNLHKFLEGSFDTSHPMSVYRFSHGDDSVISDIERYVELRIDWLFYSLFLCRTHKHAPQLLVNISIIIHQEGKDGN